MEILFKKRINKSNMDLVNYTFGSKKEKFTKSLLAKRKVFNSSYWTDLIECFYSSFKNSTTELYLEIKHPLGSFANFENEFQEIIKNNSIYYYNDNKLIVIKKIDLETLNKFVDHYYDQGLIVLMSKGKISSDITNELILKKEKDILNLDESIEKGFNLAIEFNFPSGKEIYISSNLQESYIEKCLKSINSLPK